MHQSPVLFIVMKLYNVLSLPARFKNFKGGVLNLSRNFHVFLVERISKHSSILLVN